jgi:hypothetical protein
MSRAFIKEDASPPEAEKIYEFRVYWGSGRFAIEPVVVYSSDDLFDVLNWAEYQRGYFQIRNSKGIMLAEVD